MPVDMSVVIRQLGNYISVESDAPSRIYDLAEDLAAEVLLADASTPQALAGIAQKISFEVSAQSLLLRIANDVNHKKSAWSPEEFYRIVDRVYPTAFAVKFRDIYPNNGSNGTDQ